MCRDICIAGFNAGCGEWDLSASHLRGFRNRSERQGGPQKTSVLFAAIGGSEPKLAHPVQCANVGSQQRTAVLAQSRQKSVQPFGSCESS